MPGTAQPWRGTGAGTFELTHRLLRTNNIVVTEPHNVPLQFLSETGVVGFFFAFASIAAAGVGVARRVRAREPAVVALAVLAVAYVLHSLVDFDWDFVAVTGPFLLSAGALLGGPAVRDEPRIAWAPLPVVAAIAVALSLLTPWFAERSTDSARAALADRRPLVAYRDARDARSLNPLALDPLLTQAAGSGAARRRPGRAAALHRRGRAAAAELARVVGARQLRGGPAGLRPRDPGTRARGRAGPARTRSPPASWRGAKSHEP